MEKPAGDRELIMMFERRDETALQALWLKFGSRSRRTAMQILKNESDAEECVNDAFLKVWNSIPPVMPEKLGAYVDSVVRNEAVDRCRMTHRKKDIPADMIVPADENTVADGEDGTGEIETKEIVGFISEFLRGIDPQKRRIFIGRYYLEKTVPQISEDLGIAEGTVMSTLHRTRKKLAAFLKGKGVEL